MYFPPMLKLKKLFSCNPLLIWVLLVSFLSYSLFHATAIHDKISAISTKAHIKQDVFMIIDFENQLDRTLEFGVAIRSLNYFRTCNINLHLGLMDNTTREILDNWFQINLNDVNSGIDRYYYLINESSIFNKPVIRTFLNNTGKSPMLFAKIFAASILPDTVKKVISFSPDMVMVDDICKYYKEFDEFHDEEMIGASIHMAETYSYSPKFYRVDPEIRSRRYYHYNHNGLNGGVMLHDLEKQRNRKFNRDLLNILRTKPVLDFGEQDLLNIAGAYMPSIVHLLHPRFNWQLYSEQNDDNFSDSENTPNVMLYRGPLYIFYNIRTFHESVWGLFASNKGVSDESRLSFKNSDKKQWIRDREEARASRYNSNPELGQVISRDVVMMLSFENRQDRLDEFGALIRSMNLFQTCNINLHFGVAGEKTQNILERWFQENLYYPEQAINRYYYDIGDRFFFGNSFREPITMAKIFPVAILPKEVRTAVSIDFDAIFAGDICEYFLEFDKFTDEEVIGATQEATNYYADGSRLPAFWIHPEIRQKKYYRETIGVNAGMMLHHLEHQRKSEFYKYLLDVLATKPLIELGDQCLLNLVGALRPHLVRLLHPRFNWQIMVELHEDNFAGVDDTPDVMYYHGNAGSIKAISTFREFVWELFAKNGSSLDQANLDFKNSDKKEWLRIREAQREERRRIANEAATVEATKNEGSAESEVEEAPIEVEVSKEGVQQEETSEQQSQAI